MEVRGSFLRGVEHSSDICPNCANKLNAEGPADNYFARNIPYLESGCYQGASQLYPYLSQKIQMLNCPSCGYSKGIVAD